MTLIWMSVGSVLIWLILLCLKWPVSKISCFVHGTFWNVKCKIELIWDSKCRSSAPRCCLVHIVNIRYKLLFSVVIPKWTQEKQVVLLGKNWTFLGVKSAVILLMLSLWQGNANDTNVDSNLAWACQLDWTDTSYVVKFPVNSNREMAWEHI